jgi:hypothetical protein
MDAEAVMATKDVAELIERLTKTRDRLDGCIAFLVACVAEARGDARSLATGSARQRTVRCTARPRKVPARRPLQASVHGGRTVRAAVRPVPQTGAAAAHTHTLADFGTHKRCVNCRHRREHTDRTPWSRVCKAA